MYSTFCIEEYDGRIRNTLTVKFKRSLSPYSRQHEKTNIKKQTATSSVYSTNNEIKEIQMNFEKNFLQKVQDNIDSIKLKINAKTDELINKIILRKNMLINEANNIQQKLNENLMNYLNENFVDSSSNSIEKNEPNESKTVSNFSQNEINKTDALVEFKYDDKNEFNIGRIVNLNFPLSDLERARHFLKSNQYKEAMKCLDRIIEINSNEITGEAYFLKGKCLEGLNKYDLAIQMYEKAIEKDHIGAHNLKANLLADLNESRLLYEKAFHLNKNPLKDEDFLCKGNSLYGLEKYEDAIDCYEKAIELASNYSAAYFNRANSHKSLGQFQKAIQSYDKAIELNPNDEASFFNRAICLQKLGKYEEAITSYNRVLELNPKDISSLNNKGICLGNLGIHDTAIECYNKAIKLDACDEVNSTLFNNKGFSMHNLGKYLDAISSFDKAIQLNPNNCDALNNKANSLKKLKRYKEAIKCYNKCILMNPNDDLAKKNKQITLKESKEKKSYKLNCLS
jgi:tetratricopeptide (TPR) repeat protein